MTDPSCSTSDGFAPRGDVGLPVCSCLGQLCLPTWLRIITEEEGRLTLTDYEGARLLGISRGSMRAAIAEGEIQSVRLGRRLLIPLIPLLEMMGLDPGRRDGESREAR